MANQSNSSVLRVHKNTDFTIMSNHHLRNLNLSLKAVGLMSKLLGLPDDWCYSIAGLVKICKEGETAVRAALHELIDERYVYVEKLPPNYSKSGRFEYVYHIYEIPYKDVPDGLECVELYLKMQEQNKQNADIQDTEKQDTENLHLETPAIENPRQLNTKQLSTKKSSTKELNTPASPSPSKKSESKKPFAEAVTMTETEYQKLLEQHTTDFVDKCIEVLNNYKLSNGKRYKSDYHAILSWVIERVTKDYPQLDKPVKSIVHDVNVNPFDQFV
ncbi:MAG: helix-turn-helix domain-containing protein [Ruminococcus sp.]|nr:helix-turn-helix domain-containing protein [Ruminococcus sp.]